MAIVLALVVAAIAVVFGLALAGARDATVATSENLVRAASARAAASGAVDIAKGLLNDPLVVEHSEGVLFDSLSIGDTRVRAEIRDLETGLPAGRDSRAVEILVSGDREGLVQTARAVGRIERAEDAGRADLDCSEFAILTKGPLVVDNGAHIGLWRASPLAVLAEPVRLGAASGETSLVAIDSRASVHGCVRLRCASFAADGDAADQQLADKLCQIPAPIHIPAPPLPADDEDEHEDEDEDEGEDEDAGETGPDADDDDDSGSGLSDPEGDEGSVREALLDGLVGGDARVASNARVPARSVATFRGARTLEIGGNLHIERGARVVFEGATVLVVRGNAVFEACELEIAPEASLTVIAFGDVTFDGAYAGGMRGDAEEGCDASGAAGYDGGAGKLTVFVHGEQRVLLVDGSVLKGQIYAPDARVDLESRSAVYGRLLGARVTLHEGVALFYDPALDSRRGWTNRWSGIWVADGEVDGAVREVERLDAESLRRFADASGIVPDASSAAEAAIAIAAGVSGGNSPGNAGGNGGSNSESGNAQRGQQRAQQAIQRLRDLIERGVIDGSQFVSLGFDTPDSEGER